MPLVNVKLIEGVFDDDQKREMIEKLTDTMVEIEGENMRGVTWVVIDEVKSGDWGIGGQRPHDRGRPRPRGRRARLAMIVADTAEPARGPCAPATRLRRRRRCPHRLRGLRRGRGDDPAAPAVGDRPLALLEAPGPLPGAPLPRRHLRPARQRALRPPREPPRATARAPRRSDALAVLDAAGVDRLRDRRATARPPAAALLLAADHPERVRGALFMSPGAADHAAAARAHRPLVRRRAALLRGLGEDEPPLLGARLPRLPRVLLRPLLLRAALDQADRGRGRLGARDRRRETLALTIDSPGPRPRDDRRAARRA